MSLSSCEIALQCTCDVHFILNGYGSIPFIALLVMYLMSILTIDSYIEATTIDKANIGQNRSKDVMDETKDSANETYKKDLYVGKCPPVMEKEAKVNAAPDCNRTPTWD